MQEKIKEISEKLKIDEEEVNKNYSLILKDIEKTHSELDDKQRKDFAMSRLLTRYKRLLRSNAVSFEGVVLGAAPTFDTIAKKRNDAIEAFKRNPAEATQLGLTNPDGEPLDTRKVFSTGKPNPRYGKPLPEKSLIRNVFGVASTKDGSPKFFNLTLNGDQTKIDIPMFKPVTFMAINRSPQNSDSFILNGSVVTKFEAIDEIEGMPMTGNSIDIEKIVKSYVSVSTLRDIREWHEKHKNDITRFVAVEGQVLDMGLEPTSYGSKRLVITEPELVFDESGSVPDLLCWVPEDTEIDFGVESKVIVLGQTSLGKKVIRDEEGRFVPTDEEGDVFLNAFGVYAYPEFKVPIASITEEDLDFKKAPETKNLVEGE